MSAPLNVLKIMNDQQSLSLKLLSYEQESYSPKMRKVKLIQQGSHQTEVALVPQQPTEAHRNLSPKCVTVTKSKPKDNQSETAIGFSKKGNGLYS